LDAVQIECGKKNYSTGAAYSASVIITIICIYFILLHIRYKFVICAVFYRSYYNSLKYTYPGGKLDAGKLVGRTLCWCADTELALRPLAIDCMLLSLDIAARHRHVLPDNTLSEDIQQIKKELMIEDSSVSYEAIQVSSCNSILQIMANLTAIISTKNKETVRYYLFL